MARVARDQRQVLRPLRPTIDVERAVALPNLVKSGCFTLRRKTRPMKTSVSLPNLGEGDAQFQAFLMDKGRVRQSKKKVEERGLVRQHRDVWDGIMRRARSAEEGLGGGAGVLLGRLLASLQEGDLVRPLLESIAGQAEQTSLYTTALRSAVVELREAGRGRGEELGGRRARAKLESLRGLVEAGLEGLRQEQEGLEGELELVGGLEDRLEQQEQKEGGGERKVFSPDTSTSPELLSSDSGFRTDDIEDTTAPGEETAPEEEEEEDLEQMSRKAYERFDIAWDSDTFAGTVFGDGEAELEESNLQQQPVGGLTPAMVELERYFQKQRRCDVCSSFYFYSCSVFFLYF